MGSALSCPSCIKHLSHLIPWTYYFLEKNLLICVIHCPAIYGIFFFLLSPLTYFNFFTFWF